MFEVFMIGIIVGILGVGLLFKFLIEEEETSGCVIMFGSLVFLVSVATLLSSL